jgi:hypothetical protein
LETEESFEQGYRPFLDAIMAVADTDRDGMLNVDEYIGWTGALMHLPEADARECHRRLDTMETVSSPRRIFCKRSTITISMTTPTESAAGCSADYLTEYVLEMGAICANAVGLTATDTALLKYSLDATQADTKGLGYLLGRHA